MGSDYSCYIGLDTVESYLVLRAVVLTYIYGICVSCLVAFGAMGIPCGAVCSASWVMSCATGAVLGGCRWCVTITIVTGVGCLMLVMADSVHSIGAVGDLFPVMLNGEVVHSDVS